MVFYVLSYLYMLLVLRLLTKFTAPHPTVKVGCIIRLKALKCKQMLKSLTGQKRKT